ncbi:hypothetical protein LGH83_06915 [Lichenihabitans sp. PAMC28606]|uniref:hypothetical protein n=1 Tax=Lichenihabitans sp. PAMC28606 TaxID=2880932 RepID=UPI001D0B0749|nr:hypothetical protein [Lichenihabitans sp. PAMC28606]UDL95919.1 hypothetical protein LGH83_06915 [Lichenihabitans sp. PAMC28606]
MYRRSHLRHGQVLGLGLAGLTIAMALGGCEAVPDARVGRGDVRNAIARGQLTSPRAATVALVSLDGAPDQVAARFRQSLFGEAASREITVTDEASAHYLVRGYLSAYPGETGGTTLSYVYDVFEAGRKQREQRIEDTIDLPVAAADPWSVVSDSVVTTLAGRSADDLAVALSGTPEAQAQGGKVASVAPSGQPPLN